MSRRKWTACISLLLVLASCGSPDGTAPLGAPNVEGRLARVQAVNQDIVVIAQDVEITEEMIEGLSDESFGVYASSWLDRDDDDRYKIGLFSGHPDFDQVHDRVQAYIDGLIEEGLLFEGDVILVSFENSRDMVYEAKAAFGKTFEGVTTIADSINEVEMRLDIVVQEASLAAAEAFADRFPEGLVKVTLVDYPFHDFPDGG